MARVGQLLRTQRWSDEGRHRPRGIGIQCRRAREFRTVGQASEIGGARLGGKRSVDTCGLWNCYAALRMAFADHAIQRRSLPVVIASRVARNRSQLADRDCRRTAEITCNTGPNTDAHDDITWLSM
jgi:hypothetical protein